MSEMLPKQLLFLGQAITAREMEIGTHCTIVKPYESRKYIFRSVPDVTFLFAPKSLVFMNLATCAVL